MQALLAGNEIVQMHNFTLLRGDDSGASVLVDVLAKDAAQGAVRWCGPIELERSGRQWKITTTRGIRKTARSVPRAAGARGILLVPHLLTEQRVS